MTLTAATTLATTLLARGMHHQDVSAHLKAEGCIDFNMRFDAIKAALDTRSKAQVRDARRAYNNEE